MTTMTEIAEAFDRWREGVIYTPEEMQFGERPGCPEGWGMDRHSAIAYYAGRTAASAEVERYREALERAEAHLAGDGVPLDATLLLTDLRGIVRGALRPKP